MDVFLLLNFVAVVVLVKVVVVLVKVVLVVKFTVMVIIIKDIAVDFPLVWTFVF